MALLFVPGCSGFTEVSDPDLARDLDGDMGLADRGAPDQSSGDQSPGDGPPLDQGNTDSRKDQGQPDQVQPDQSPSDQTLPDQTSLVDQHTGDVLFSPSIGKVCTNFGNLCPDGQTYCIAYPFDSCGFCTKTCQTTNQVCTGMPPGTHALCNIKTRNPILLCGFVCKDGGKTYSCPNWPYGSYCDSSGLCHPN